MRSQHTLQKPGVHHAGLAGLLGVTGGLHFAQAAPVPTLRSLNPYVTASLEEWASGSRLEASICRQPAAAHRNHDIATAGAALQQLSWKAHPESWT